MPEHKYLFEKLGRIPYNEFSEINTADMPSSDYMWHCWMHDEFKKVREEWEKKIKNTKNS